MASNQAAIVKQLIAENNPAACSAAYGYLVRYNGQIVSFSDHGAPVPRVISETRRAGRVTRAVYLYPDNSSLVYSWAPVRGAHYAAIASTTTTTTTEGR